MRATPARDKVMVLLSVKAGLRACEIANLDWSMVLDARGKVADTLAVRDVIAKKRAGRRIPMHPELRRALMRLRRERPRRAGDRYRPRAGTLGPTASSIGSPRCSPSSASTAAPRIRAAHLHHHRGPQPSSFRV